MRTVWHDFGSPYSALTQPLRGLLRRPSRLMIALALVLCSGATAAADDEPSGDQPPGLDYQLDVALQLIPVVVRDDFGRAVQRLPRSAFRLRVDSRAVAIEHFEPAARPVALALVFDQSVSMLGDRQRTAERVARKLIRKMERDDRALIVAFDHRIELHHPLTSDRAALERALLSLTSGGGTSLYDAVDYAAQLLSPLSGSRAVVLFSDGEDGTNRASLTDVARRAHAATVALFPIWVGERGRPTSLSTSSIRKRVDDAARELGGSTIDAASPGIDATLDEWLARLRSGYLLGYAGVATSDIEVSLTIDGLTATPERHWRAPTSHRLPQP